MRALFYFWFLFLCITQCYTQLYVGPNSYVFVNDQYVTVNQDVNLSATGNVFLRREAQLLQRTTGSSTNSGQGSLSLFQEGTVNNFQFNYWCSPVGSTSGGAGNGNFSILQFQRPTGVITSSPVTTTSGVNGTTTNTSLQLSSYWIFKFLSSDAYSQWFPVGTASNIAPGEGFTMKGVSGTDNTEAMADGIDNNPGSNQRYDFRGKPNDGNITITVANNKLTLTGNPYPSAIDLSQFLTDAVNCTGTAYFWQHDKTVNSHLIADYRGGYGTYTPVSRSGTGIYVPAQYFAFDGSGNQIGGPLGIAPMIERFFAPIGQGFSIMGNSLGTTVTMRNNYRVFRKEGVVNQSQFERNGASTENSGVPNNLGYIPSVSGFDYTTVSLDPAPQIRFSTVLNNQAVREVALGFDEMATDGEDHAMDGLSVGGAATADMYFLINEKPYVINVIDFDISKRLPIGFKNNAQATYKISVSEILNFDEAENVYIFDKETQMYHDIKNGSYEFTLPAGEHNDRYEITFINQILSTPTLTATDFDILQDNAQGQLIIRNPNNIELKDIILFDINGKRIIENLNLDAQTEYRISTQNLSEAVYIVKLITRDNEDFGKKITVFNN